MISCEGTWSTHARFSTNHVFERMYGLNRFTTRRNGRLIDLITVCARGQNVGIEVDDAGVSILGADDVERGR